MEKKDQSRRIYPRAFFSCVFGSSFFASVIMIVRDPSGFIWNCYFLLVLLLFCSSCFLLCKLFSEKKSLFITVLRVISGIGACFTVVQIVNVLRFGGLPNH